MVDTIALLVMGFAVGHVFGDFMVKKQQKGGSNE